MSSQDRRTFLGNALGAGAFLVSTPGSTAPDALGPMPPRSTTQALDEAYWERVKRSFPLAPGLVLMNAANLCPSPFVVQDAVFAWTRDVDADTSVQNPAKYVSL